MVQRIQYALMMILVLVCVSSPNVLAQGSANLLGLVKDAQTGDALPGANVLLVGSGIGATTDLEGKYAIRRVPAGTYTLRLTYIGYGTLTATVTVKDGIDVRKDFKMSAVAIEGETVVVTAQAAGQNEAINQQLSSMPVMNVVSAARIQELPDANAAESVSRLPGVSLVRTGGEGSRVVIRGLSPQFNQITIDGVEMPSDVASSNNITAGDASAQESQTNQLGDRAEDLSMISSSMLGGIEVIKAITPDMDATLIGGVVNFGLRKAGKNRSITGPDGTVIDESWIPSVDLKVQGGYNNLKNTKSDYRFVASLEKRFFNDQFGVFVQGSSEQRNLSSNTFGAGYNLIDKDKGDAGIPDLSSMDIGDVYRTRKRLGATVVLDYTHESGEIGLMNFASNSDTRAVNRGETIQPVIDQIVYTAGESNNTLNVISNLLSVKQELPLFHMDLRLSHSYSESKSPQDLSFQFTQTPSGYANKGTIVKSPPSYIYSFLKPNASLATLAGMSTSETFSRERALTGSLDLQTDLPVIEGITSKIKFGASWQHRSRTYEYNQNNGTAWHDDGLINNLLKVYPGYLMGPTGDISMLNFVYDGYSYGKILNGDYNLPYPINVDEMWKILPIVKATTQIGSRGGYQYNLIASRINDYDGTEDKSGGYAMMTVNIGDQISVLPGIRYQNLTSKYSSLRGMLVPNGIQGHDTTVTDTHGEWLPMVHVRYRATDWLQIHLAYTNTLNYADYSAITPRYLIGTGYITYNNHQLKPARSENFDLVVAFHSNEIGLFTVNGFKKQIKDLIFYSKTYVTNVSKYPELPPLSNALYEFNTYINNPNRINIYGVETEWQTHFWYLPQPFTGIVLNFNYTHIFSEAKYPKSSVDYQYNDDGTFTATFTDTSYTTRMLDQPNDIVNLTIGYDYEGFSARVSMLYQDNIFKKPDFWSQLRTTSAKYTRWDLSVKQQLPWFGMQVFFNMNNITGENEIDLNPKTNFLASEQRYGMSADFGIMIRL